MMNLTIKDIMDKPAEEHDEKLQKALNNDPEYIEARQKIEAFLEKIKGFDKEVWFNLDAEINYMEARARDTAFNEGFKLAVRLILSSMQ